MKRFLLFIAFFCAVALSSSSAPSVTNAAKAAQKERAVIKFTQPVQLMGVTLSGEYLFVHDDAAMARGEACTSVFKGTDETRDNLVVSFHCTPVGRIKSATFAVRTMQTLPGQTELKEFQFAGSKEAHLVPASLHAMHMPVAGMVQQQGGGGTGGGAGGGGGVGLGNGGRVLAGGTVVVTGPVLPQTPPAPDVLMRESFGPGAANQRPSGGKGTLKLFTIHTAIAGFWIEYPGSNSTVWLAPPEPGQTWRACASSDNPFEMFSPLQVPPAFVTDPTMIAQWAKNGCLVADSIDGIVDHPTALMPFKAPTTAYQVSLDVYPNGGPYVGFGLTGSSVLDSNLETSGSVWFEVTPNAGGVDFINNMQTPYTLRANGRTGPVLASGIASNFDFFMARLVLRYDPVTKLVSGSVNGIELGVFPMAVANPKFIAIEGIGFVDNLVVRKLP